MPQAADPLLGRQWPGPVTALAVRDAYRLWAPTYSGETAVTFLEARIVDAITPPLHGLRLLDAGCGTGRRLRGIAAASAVGVDACPEMLEAGLGIGSPASGIRTIVGDVRGLPLPDRAFDVVWCRLVLGHLPELAAAYAELARVADDSATVIVSDFHPAAHAAGHRRTFRADGAVHEVAHHVHGISDHGAAAAAAGLELLGVRVGSVGSDVRGFYAAAGRLALYRKHHGLPLVLVMSFQRGS